MNASRHAVRAEKRSAMYAVLVSALSIATSSCTEGPSTAERTGETLQSVVHGFLDVDERYSGVVALAPPAQSYACSAVVITPWWVLTAAHCFIDGPLDAEGDFNVVLGHDLTTPIIIPHTRDIGGAVFVANHDAQNCNTDSCIVGDIALFRVDRRIPRKLARPIHPPMLPGDTPCPDNLQGVMVGFGGDVTGNGVPNCAGPLNIRKFYPDLNALEDSPALPPSYRHVVSNGSVFRRGFPIPIPVWSFCDDYYGGTTSGDSGGALLDPSGKLCGIHHGAENNGSTVFNIDAAVDSDVNSTSPLFGGNPLWIRTRVTEDGHSVLDAKGYFEGECPRATYECEHMGVCDDSDPDEDGIITPCDDCPFVWNPEQVTGNDDPDHNGHGAACDLCASQSYSFDPLVGNRNGEAALAIAYPTLDRAPIVKGDSLFPLVERERYLAAFAPNICDPRAVAVQSIAGSGSLPTAAIPIVQCGEIGQLPVPNCNCPAGADCSWQVEKNRLALHGTDSAPA